MKFKNTRVTNFEGAFRGLRNPLESWEKSDSSFGFGNEENEQDFQVAEYYVQKNGYSEEKNYNEWINNIDIYSNWLRDNGILYINEDCIFEYAYIGPKDLDLAQRMIIAGASDRKFLRQIFVSVDITAPLYWWKEFDTYKISTVANSTSTMHKLSTTPIDIKCFELDDFEKNLVVYPDNGVDPDFTIEDLSNSIITYCESLRKLYNKTKDKKYWKELIRWLPNGWLQTRTITLNYENLRNIFFQRRNHKLTEWHQFCNWIKNLPYGKELITFDKKEKK